MTQGWSESDKQVAKAALERAKRKAEEFVLKEFHNHTVKSVDDLWILEQKIQKWRKDIRFRFVFAHDTIEHLLSECLKNAWLSPSDIKTLSPARSQRILKQASA